MNTQLSTQDVQLIEESLGDFIKDFKVNTFQHTNVVVLTSLKDAKLAKQVLYTLCFKAEIVEGTNKNIEVIFN